MFDQWAPGDKMGEILTTVLAMYRAVPQQWRVVAVSTMPPATQCPAFLRLSQAWPAHADAAVLAEPELL